MKTSRLEESQAMKQGSIDCKKCQSCRDCRFYDSVMKNLAEKGIEVVIFEPILTSNEFNGYKVIKKASKKNKMVGSSLRGGVAQLKSNNKFGYTDKKGKYHGNSVTGFDAYYWYTKWTNDPTDCEPDFSNVEFTYDKDGSLIGAKAIDANVVSPCIGMLLCL